jgi:hypothetical protein
MIFEREFLTSLLSPSVRGEAGRIVSTGDRLSVPKREGRVRVLLG